MKEKFLETIAKSYPLSEESAGEFASFTMMGMDFKVEKYKAEGFGYVSWMTASGMNGAMHMDTVVVNCFNMDLPLFSYDRIQAMGKDTCIIELYDTMLEPFDCKGFDQAKAMVEAYPDMPANGEHWYDAIRYPQSIAKVGEDSAKFDEAVLAYIAEFIKEANAAPKCDEAKKRERAGQYSTSLAHEGGFAADNFIKTIGLEKTEEFFKTVLFNA